jgi:hypothetical protein
MQRWFMQLGDPATGDPAAGDQLQQGDSVRVSQSVVVFHHPQHRGEAFDLKGQQGEVLTVLNEWKGRVISPNLPVVVVFGKFRAHFRADELERA